MPPSSPPPPTPKQTHLDLTSFFTPPSTAPSTSPDIYQNRALLILNSPIPSLELLEQLWRTCRWKVCADGGANRLFDFLSERREEGGFLPTHIHGDLDSVRPDVSSFYTTQHVPLIKDPDQYSTDFGKCLKLIRKLLPVSDKEDGSSPAVIDILVLGSIAGRLDHGLGLLHEMGREHDQHPNYRLWLVSECSVSMVLGGGGETSIIRTRSDPSGSQQDVFEKNIGIVPLYGKAVISTKGLEWDVTGWETEMGGQVSTSNHVLGGEVEVRTDVKVLFTIERGGFR